MTKSPYVIGIDLGTTNTAMAFSKDEDGATIEIFKIPQIADIREIKERTTLPSFIYIPGSHELPEGAAELPWGDFPYIIGEFALKQGLKVPDRLVSSSKSWLCANAVDREGMILPWGSDSKKVAKISPVESAMRCLTHLYEAWNYKFKDVKHASFCIQDIALTVPASFDAVARELTVKAATASNMDVTLLEEPQAALYAWLFSMGEEWRKILKLNDTVLVCDIGGGTTDFSLIAVSENEGNLELERIAVGDHILLGGDNMDLAAAMALYEDMRARKKVKLEPWQLNAMARSCSAAKERMLSDNSVKEAEIIIPGRSSSIFGGSLTALLKRETLERIIFDGFFRSVPLNSRPEPRRRLGLAEIGLPYEHDAVVTRHLAAFLSVNRETLVKKGYAPLPTHLLLNGGVFKSEAITSRFIAALKEWYPDGESFTVLKGADLDLSVAKGAAAYALSKRGKGIRIKGGTSRSYYIGIETSMPSIPGFEPPVKALCIAGKGVEEGTKIKLDDREFALGVGYEAEFRFFSSSTREDDAIGNIVENWEDVGIKELPSLKVFLESDNTDAGFIPVKLETYVTEIGTIELWCISADGFRRKLEFDVRHSDAD